MDPTTLIQRLQAAYHAPAAREFDAAVRLHLGSQPHVMLRVHHGDMKLYPAPTDEQADFTLYFTDAEQALALLTGKADPVAAFMAHEFRADGYLILVFSVLALFR